MIQIIPPTKIVAMLKLICNRGQCCPQNKYCVANHRIKSAQRKLCGLFMGFGVVKQLVSHKVVCLLNIQQTRPDQKLKLYLITIFNQLALAPDFAVFYLYYIPYRT